MFRIRLVRLRGKQPFHSRGRTIFEIIFGVYYEELMFGRLKRRFLFNYIKHNQIRRFECAAKGPLILRFEGKQRSPTRYYHDA
jgi:hypothetical protein